MYSVGVKWTMITVRFGLMVMLRIANTGSIYTTLAYLANMKMKKCLLNSYSIIVKVITPIVITPTYRQTPNNITKATTKIYQKFDELGILRNFCYNFPAGIYLFRVHNKKN